MEVKEAILKRYSVRSYQDRPIPDEVLEELLEVARLAPSASNRQPWKLVVVKDRDLRERLAVAAKNQSFVAEAPVVLAIVALDPERHMSCEVPAYAVDLAIVLDHITLMATDLGLGSCWIGAFSQPRVKEVLKIPPEYKVAGLLPLGYPADTWREKKRKDLTELYCYDSFAP